MSSIPTDQTKRSLLSTEAARSSQVDSARGIPLRTVDRTLDRLGARRDFANDGLLCPSSKFVQRGVTVWEASGLKWLISVHFFRLPVGDSPYPRLGSFSSVSHKRPARPRKADPRQGGLWRTRHAIRLGGLLALAGLLLAGGAYGQNEQIKSVPVIRGAEALPPVKPVFVDVDLRSLTTRRAWQPGDGIKMIPRRYYLSAKLVDSQSNAKAPVKKADPLLDIQDQAELNKVLPPPLLNFSGGGFTGASPPDTVGDIGTTYYIQSTNSSGGAVFSVYDKETGALVAGPVDMSDLANGAPGIVNCSSGLGDPIILYDQAAGRWLLSEFSSTGNKLCVYISATGDPISGGWHAYEFSAPSFPDYPKYAAWIDAYYVGTNESGGPGVYALDRTSMLAGQAASMQRFTGPSLNGFGFQMITPADFDGANPPPANSPALFLRHNDDEAHNPGSNNAGNDFLEVFEFDVDFANAANSSFTGPLQIPIADFDSHLCGFSTFVCIPQPNGGIGLDPLREVVMFRPQYRNTGAYESIVGTHVTDVDTTDHAGIRWWELRRTGGGAWSLVQEGTYAPDVHSRWMSSSATDQDGNLAIGYSTGSSTLTAGIRYNGRLQADPLGTLTQGETVLILGTGTHSNERWGDYSDMTVDPVDDCTFWYTNEHALANGTWATRIGKFKYDSCGTPGIVLSGTNLSQSVCAPGSLDPITLTVSGAGGFTGSTALSFPSLPAGFSGNFSSTPVVPTAQSTATLTMDAQALYNQYLIEILATTTGADNQSLTADLSVNTLIPSSPSLLVPPDGGTNISTTGYFDWDPVYQGSSYLLEVDDDPSFSSIDLAATGSGTSHVAASPLAAATTYYWRVTASNPCGATQTPVRSFTTSTSNSFCSSPNLLFSSNAPASVDLVIPQTGAITSMDVSLDITHTWVGDVQISLVNQQTSTSVLLVDRPGHTPSGGGFGCSSNDFLTTLSDSSTTPVENECSATPPAVAGMLGPQNLLSSFNGEDLAGTWTLQALDLANGDAGVINQWCILPSQVPEPGSALLLVSGILFMCGERHIRGRRRRAES